MSKKWNLSTKLIIFIYIKNADDVHYSSQVNEQAEADYINLEQLVVAAQQTFSGSFVREHLNARVLGPTISDDLTYQLYAYVLAEKVLEDDVTLDWHGRASFDVYGWRNRLRLLFGRHRVNGIVDGTVTVPATYWRKFPAANVHVDALGAPVRWAQLHTPRWEQEGET